LSAVEYPPIWTTLATLTDVELTLDESLNT